MTFDPAGGRHAVIEAVFGIRLDTPPSKDEVNQIFALHEELKGDLPKASRPEGIFLFVGGQPPGDPPFAAHLSFESFKKDGSHEWRLRVEDNAILVNCLTYTRWKEISEKSLIYIRKISSVLAQRDRSISNIFLQYLDRFNWSKTLDEYDLNLLLAKNCKYVGDFAFEVGPTWHSHQGWFEYSDQPANGRTLNRTNVTAKVENGLANVLIDHYLQFESAENLNFGETVKEGGAIEVIFEALHQRNKSVLADLLTKETAAKIELSGSKK